MNKQRALEWIVNGEVGISSKTMFAALFGVPYDRADFPHDSDDFRRCYLFARTAKLTPKDFETICKIYPWWRNIYDIWYDMEAALVDHNGIEIYDLLNEPTRYSRLMYQAKGLVEVGDGLWYNEEHAKREGKHYVVPK